MNESDDSLLENALVTREEEEYNNDMMVDDEHDDENDDDENNDDGNENARPLTLNLGDLTGKRKVKLIKDTVIIIPVSCQFSNFWLSNFSKILL